MAEIIVSVVANGEQIEPSILKKYTEDSSLIIAADGGLQQCHDAPIEPDYIIGDLDSSDLELLKDFPKIKIEKISDQDSTDLEKTIRFARRFKPTIIRFFAIFGLRVDHAMANMILIQNFVPQIAVEVYDNYGKMILLHPGDHQIMGKTGQTVSFFSLNSIKNLTIEGFKYPLINHTDPQAFFGISNIYTSRNCRVSFSQGDLLMYELFQQ